MTRRIDEISSKIQSASSSSSGTENRIQEMVERIENIQEKMYDFEVNKRNNLLFYGIKEDRRETPSELLIKVRPVSERSSTFLYRSGACCETPSLSRERSRSARPPECSLGRMLEDAGSRASSVQVESAVFLLFRPVVVSFEEFKDRDEVLRKAGVLKGNNIHITEDMSRWARF